jgi:hypothetical protein
MTTYKRFGNRWTVNECLQLQREFELLNLSIDEISVRHQRTPNAIMLKLDQENLADYNVLYSNYNKLNTIMSTQQKHEFDGCDTELEDDYDEEEEDCDNSSNYTEEDCEDEEIDEDEEFDEDEDDNSCDNGSYDAYNLKHHVMRLEKQLNTLTEMLLKQTNSKSTFSLFA